MINIPVDEAYAFDYLSILEVKNFNKPSQENQNKFLDTFNDLKSQFGDKVFYEAKESTFYKNIYNTNAELYKNIGKGNKVRASYIDYLNWVRFIHKREMQLCFFKTEQREQKFGYNWSYIFTKNSFIIILVSPEDLDLFSKENWNVHNGYIFGSSSHEFMHRKIFKDQGINIDGKDIDHKNNNKWDNRRENLRIATKSQNSANKLPGINCKSGYKGVVKTVNGWRASIVKNRKQFIIGYFDKAEHAAIAYDLWSSYMFEEFGYVNMRNAEEVDINFVIRSLFKARSSKRKRSSKYFGVSYHNKTQKWLARVSTKNGEVRMGSFNSEIEAAKKVDEKLLELNREFELNFDAKIPTKKDYFIRVDKILNKKLDYEQR